MSYPNLCRIKQACTASSANLGLLSYHMGKVKLFHLPWVMWQQPQWVYLDLHHLQNTRDPGLGSSIFDGSLALPPAPRSLTLGMPSTCPRMPFSCQSAIRKLYVNWLQIIRKRPMLNGTSFVCTEVQSLISPGRAWKNLCFKLWRSSFSQY